MWKLFMSKNSLMIRGVNRLESSKILNTLWSKRRRYQFKYRQSVLEGTLLVTLMLLNKENYWNKKRQTCSMCIYQLNNHPVGKLRKESQIFKKLRKSFSKILPKTCLKSTIFYSIMMKKLLSMKRCRRR